jgi:hypothetical protein
MGYYEDEDEAPISDWWIIGAGVILGVMWTIGFVLLLWWLRIL